MNAPPGAAPIIEAKGLTRIYRMGASDVVGVSGVDLVIAPGELATLKGASGSGKSTLLALLGGLDQPTGGSLTVAGQDLQKATEAELTRYRRDVTGIVFQSFNLLPTLTVLENICLPALLAGKSHEETRNKASGVVEWLGLRERRDHLPSQLSGGEMQRTAIARALINDPQLLLADEPTGNLDSRNGAIVVELLAELNRTSGRTVVIATHGDMADAYATMQITLKDGAIHEILRK